MPTWKKSTSNGGKETIHAMYYYEQLGDPNQDGSQDFLLESALNGINKRQFVNENQLVELCASLRALAAYLPGDECHNE